MTQNLSNPHPEHLRIQSELLFAGAVPGAQGSDLIDVPAISVHLPAPQIANGAAVIVAPGGGYRTLAADHEGLQVARWLNRIGVAAFVLRYRVGPKYHSNLSLEDGKQAVRYLRKHAKRFRISSQRIGFLGFSAGGHLALSISTRWHEVTAYDGGLGAHSARPDFVIGGYAVTNGAVRGKKADEYLPTDTAVRADTPPTFLMHTHADSVVASTQSTLHYNALQSVGVPAELHIFNFGDHSLGLMPGDPDSGHWCHLLQRWMRRHGLLTARQRIEITGRLSIDGVAPGIAWVTLLPLDSSAPAACVCVNRASEGKFLIPCSEGPVSGAHVVEVHQVSDSPGYDARGIFSLPDARFFRREIFLEPGLELTLHLKSDELENSSELEATRANQAKTLGK